MWKFKKTTAAKVEAIGAALGIGEPGWVRPNMRIFTKTYQMKGVDWLNMSRGAGLHIFDSSIGVDLPDDIAENLVEAWEALMVMFQMCCIVTCNVDGEPPTEEMTKRYNSYTILK